MYRFMLVGLSIIFILSGTAKAEDGVTSDQIILGQSCALEGMASSLGQGMATGLNVYFDYINAQGGIKGRKIKLISVDDGYETLKAVQVTQDLVNQKKIFLLIGEVGTPTSKAVMPIVEKSQIPFVAPFTGAELLRNPFKKWVVNVRGSYYQEMEKLAQYLVDKKGYHRIACFYQNDAYGQAGLDGIELALSKRNLSLIGKGNYERNTLSIHTALEAIKATNPEAIVMVGAYLPCAAFIKSAKSTPELENAVYCNISFVGTKALKEALGEAGDNCLVSQVVPYPWDTSLPLVEEYTKLMEKAGKADKIDFVTLEGYMGAKLFCQVMERIEGEPTREKFISTLENIGKFDLGGITMNFGPQDHQGMDEVFIVEFQGNQMVLVQK